MVPPPAEKDATLPPGVSKAAGGTFPPRAVGVTGRGLPSRSPFSFSFSAFSASSFFFFASSYSRSQILRSRRQDLFLRTGEYIYLCCRKHSFVQMFGYIVEIYQISVVFQRFKILCISDFGGNNCIGIYLYSCIIALNCGQGIFRREKVDGWWCHWTENIKQSFVKNLVEPKKILLTKPR